MDDLLACMCTVDGCSGVAFWAFARFGILTSSFLLTCLISYWKVKYLLRLYCFIIPLFRSALLRWDIRVSTA